MSGQNHKSYKQVGVKNCRYDKGTGNR